MVHADVEIAGFDELEQAGAENIKFLHAFREVGGKGALLFFKPRHIGIADESDAIRGEADDLIDGVSESVGGLVGQAVDQIDVDTVEAELASGEEEVASHFVRLNSMNRLLHLGLEVLDAHAETVEAQLAESFEMLAGSYAGIDFDADFTVGIEMEMLFREGEEILDLLGREVGGCAAAPVELDDRTIFRNAAADALHFLLEHVKIGWGDTFVFLDDD